MEATVPRHKYPICDPLGSPTIHLSVSLYREGWNTFDLCESVNFYLILTTLAREVAVAAWAPHTELKKYSQEQCALDMCKSFLSSVG